MTTLQHALVALTLTGAATVAFVGVKLGNALDAIGATAKEAQTTLLHAQSHAIAIRGEIKSAKREAAGEYARLRGQIVDPLIAAVPREYANARRDMAVAITSRVDPLSAQVQTTLQASQGLLDTYRQLPSQVAGSPFVLNAQGEALGTMRSTRVAAARFTRAMPPVIADVQRGGDAAASVAESVREITDNLRRESERPLPWWARLFWRKRK